MTNKIIFITTLKMCKEVVNCEEYVDVVFSIQKVLKYIYTWSLSENFHNFLIRKVQAAIKCSGFEKHCYVSCYLK